MSKQTPALLQPRAATKAELQQTVTTPADPLLDLSPFGGVRRPVDDVWMGELSPTRVLTVLKEAQAGTDRGELAKMAEVIIRRNPNLQSNLQTRVLALAGYDLICDPVSDSRRDKKVAEAVNTLLAAEIVAGMVPEMAYGGIWHNYSLHENVWAWEPEGVSLTGATYLPPHWLVFDPRDGVTPLLKPRTDGAPYEPLLEGGKYTYHKHGILPGLTLTSGLAYTAAFYYAIANIALKDWLGFVEMFGQPFRIGTYDKSMSGEEARAKKQRDALKKALQNLGADAWAMLPEGAKIEIVEAATSGATDAYERICRYLDECLARLILGGNLTSGTGNTGSGGSQALGNVHNEVRMDRVWADAKAIAKTLKAKVVTPFVHWNFGENVPVPNVRFKIEAPANLQAVGDFLAKMVPLGLEVAQDEVRSLGGFRAPKAGEAVLGAPASVQAPADPQNPGQPVDPNADPVKAPQDAPQAAKQTAAAQATADEIDALIAEYDRDYAPVQDAIDKKIAAAVASLPDNATLKDFRKVLASLIDEGEFDDLQAMFTAALTSTKAAGEFGVDLGGEHISDKLNKQ